MMESNANPLWKIWTIISIPLGVMSLLALPSSIMAMEEHIGQWVFVFTSFTRPIADFLFGWTVAFWGWELPTMVKDYFIVGLVILGGWLRAIVFTPSRPLSLAYIMRTLQYGARAFLFWPFIIFKYSKWSLTGTPPAIVKKRIRILFSTTMLFGIVVLINLALLSYGFPAFQQ